MSSISVRPQMVDSLSTDIANDAKGIGQELENLDAEVRTLIDQWDGAAQEAYHRAQNDWTTKLQEITRFLARFLRPPLKSPSSMWSPTTVRLRASDSLTSSGAAWVIHAAPEHIGVVSFASAGLADGCIWCEIGVRGNTWRMTFMSMAIGCVPRPLTC